METKTFYDYIATSMLLSDEVTGEMEQLAEQYPWFALAQQIVLENYHATNDGRYAGYSARVALSAPSREHLYRRLYQTELALITSCTASLPANDDALLDVAEQDEEQAPFVLEEEPEEELELLEEEKKPVQKVQLTGSDYFAAEEFTINTTLDDPIARFIIDKPKINPYTSPLLGISMEDLEPKTPSLENFDIVTETLAKIYEEQGFYSLAVNAYEKLILLDRKKSAYFADRIKEMKSKHK